MSPIGPIRVPLFRGFCIVKTAVLSALIEDEDDDEYENEAGGKPQTVNGELGT